MGLLGKVILGAMLNNARKNSDMSSGNQSNVQRGYECRYCGRRLKKYGPRPLPTQHGTCKNSPYGTHYWDEV